jgi:predicted glutamine amidotransferase
MLGFSADHPLSIAPFLDALAHQAQYGVKPGNRPHEDGWGMLVRTPAGFVHARFDHAMWKSDYDGFRHLCATVGVFHARLASENTPIDLTKVHPFCARSGNDLLAFCHNGSVGNVALMPRPTRISLPEDAIDSEIYFSLVREMILDGQTPAEALRSAAQNIFATPCEASSLNALLLAGNRLAAFKGRTLPSYSHYHTLSMHKGDGCIVISTEPVSGFGEPEPLVGALELENGQVLKQIALS